MPWLDLDEDIAEEVGWGAATSAAFGELTWVATKSVAAIATDREFAEHRRSDRALRRVLSVERERDYKRRWIASRRANALPVPCAFCLAICRPYKTKFCSASCGIMAAHANRAPAMGQRFGMLVVLGRGRDRHGARWRCHCDCGREVLRFANDLRLGKSTSCGCSPNVRGTSTRVPGSEAPPRRYPPRDRSGPPRPCEHCGAQFVPAMKRTIYCSQRCGASAQWNRSLTSVVGSRFGRLRVVERTTVPRAGGVYWICQCDCGATVTARTAHLRGGKVKSCGCLRRESNSNRKVTTIDQSTMRNAQFGKLTVIERAAPAKVDKSGSAYWLCSCECGGTKVAKGNSLRSGAVKSCGCLPVGRRRAA